LIQIFVCTSLLFSCDSSTKPAESTAEKTVSEETPAEMKEYEVGDAKYVGMVRKGLEDLTSGNIDSWMSTYADNAIFRWNGVDSMVGKPPLLPTGKKVVGSNRLAFFYKPGLATYEG